MVRVTFPPDALVPPPPQAASATAIVARIARGFLRCINGILLFQSRVPAWIVPAVCG
jgi:hypothetical protein